MNRSPRTVISGALTLVAAAAFSGTVLPARSLGLPQVEPITPALGSVAQAMAKASGSFRKAEAPVSGGFTISQQGGKTVLTLSGDFKTNDMAPDLWVAFSPTATPLAMSKAPAFPLKPGSYTLLSKLKSSKGSQSYVIPASIDLKAQKSVLIWCQKFNATMAWAPLKP
ncbi:DM13 domain-containing protein [Cyanobium gracile]|uniref:Electron transfer protein with DM13 domain n=1 Tax=Cyanobium gracile (strain ATCC 27147 / PCC 6307) TaxID=292564 RepID=K9PAX4_CYAGP|nr:DM13 domain-containing protein [Cyanobium gracile]AFY29749.1 electron transfer protein with DM13 domain [Cyanobium gracile PCC 6307]